MMVPLPAWTTNSAGVVVMVFLPLIFQV